MPNHTIELTSEEAELLSQAASARANEYVRSGAQIAAAEPTLRVAWMHNANLLRALAARLANLK